jgi:mycofactocin biosynthesis protein MftB
MACAASTEVTQQAITEVSQQAITEVSQPAMSAGEAGFDPAQPWRLSSGVALRDESFGALAYDFATRRLSFLKTRQLVDVVRGLESAPDVHSALTAASVPQGDWTTYLGALEGLAHSGMITPR